MKFLLYILLFGSITITTTLNPVTALLSFAYFISLTIPLFLFGLNFEYFAFLFLIIYLGAILILFLFVIMSLDGRKRQNSFHVPLSRLFVTLFISIFLEVLLCMQFDSSISSSTEFLELLLSNVNVWPEEDIDFYVFAYNELWSLIIIAALVLILAFFCVIVIGEFIKKLL